MRKYIRKLVAVAWWRAFVDAGEHHRDMEAEERKERQQFLDTRKFHEIRDKINNGRL